MRHPLINTLVNLRGNPRACVYTEPMWGLSMNLCLPYMSVFMLAIGLNDVEVGIIASIYMASQIFFSLMSGALTDKLGRRKSLAIFDALGWSVPTLIWLFAVDFKFFLVAALFNGAMRVPMNSFNCLLIEDTDKKQMTHIYSLIMISGCLSAFFSPISAILISRLTLIPAVRILFVNAFIIMTTKIVLLYFLTRETTIGVARMKETKEQSYISHLLGNFKVLRLMRGSRGLVFSITIFSLFTIISMINSTFWQIFVSKKLDVPESALPLFTTFRAAISLVLFFAIIARVNQLRLKYPLLLGFASFFAGQVILLLTPTKEPLKYVFLCLSLTFDGLGAGMLATLSEAMIALHSDEKERARVLAIYQVIVMIVCMPFGFIGGLLSDISRNLPFILNLTLIAAGAVATLVYYRTAAGKSTAQ